MANKIYIDVPKIFLPSYHDKRPYQIWYGSRFSAKSWTKALFFLMQCRSPEYFRLVFARDSQKNVKNSQYQLFKDIARKFGLYEEYQWFDSTMRIEHKATKNIMLGGSFEQPDTLRSIADVTDFWAEEPITRKFAIDEESFLDIAGSLRNSYGVVPRFHFTFNPITTKNFVYRNFFDPKTKKYSESEVNIVKANYYDNPFCPPDRIEFLENLKLTNPERYKVDGLGEWGKILVKNPFITSSTLRLFNPELRYDPRLPISLSLDVNNEPLTILVSQKSHGKHTRTHGFIRTVDEIKVTKELQLKYPMHEKFMIAALVIRERYPNAPIMLTGDASGWAGNPLLKGNTASFYLHFANILNLNPETQIKTPRSNLQHTVSQTLCNSALSYHPNLQINPNTCPELASEISSAEIDDKGKLIKDRGENKLDSFDAWRYELATTLYPNWLNEK